MFHGHQAQARMEESSTSPTFSLHTLAPTSVQELVQLEPSAAELLSSLSHWETVRYSLCFLGILFILLPGTETCLTIQISLIFTTAEFCLYMRGYLNWIHWTPLTLFLIHWTPSALFLIHWTPLNLVFDPLDPLNLVCDLLDPSTLFVICLMNIPGEWSILVHNLFPV